MGINRRFELQLTAVDPYTDPALTNAPFLSYVLKLVTADHDLELDTFSYVQSLPGSVHQPWHVDVNTLFHRDVSNLFFSHVYQSGTGVSTIAHIGRSLFISFSS